MPEVETERLLMRMFTPGDVERHLSVVTHPEFMRYFPAHFSPSRDGVERGIAARLEHWERHGYGQWALTEKGRGELFGYCGLRYLPETDEVELLYGIDPAHWGRGLTTEAAKASVRFGFEEARLARIMAVANPLNTGSRRVMEKAGLRYEKNALYFEMDCAYYALDREDFRPDASLYVLRP
jgi:RimJ/RimL family protein N-acetyltransferase